MVEEEQRLTGAAAIWCAREVCDGLERVRGLFEQRVRRDEPRVLAAVLLGHDDEPTFVVGAAVAFRVDEVGEVGQLSGFRVRDPDPVAELCLYKSRLMSRTGQRTEPVKSGDGITCSSLLHHGTRSLTTTPRIMRRRSTARPPPSLTEQARRDNHAA